MIGQILAMYRYKNDLTVRAMAEILGVSAATISRIEHGREIDAKTLVKLFNWLFVGLT